MATLSAATLAIVYWGVKIFFAVACGIAGLCAAIAPMWWTDRKRQQAAPAPHLQMAMHGHDVKKLARRKAPLFSKSDDEPVARLSDVIKYMQTGDILDFCGRKFHSYINRIIRWCRSSHSAMVYRDKKDRVWVAEVIENIRIIRNGWRFKVKFGGFRLVRIEDYVAKYSGQLYWARIADVYANPHYTMDGEVIPPLFDRSKAARAIEASTKWGYGWACIGLQILQIIPFVKTIVYLRTWRNIGKNWGPDHAPDCSCAVSIWCEIAGEDPVPQLAAQLTTPAEIERTKLTDEPIALAA